MIGKLYDWVCNCFKHPPRAGSDPNDRCNVEAGGYGENPMQGLGCTEPPIGPDGDLPVVDPPRCYGGLDGPCDPMPPLFRVAFPCKVPGSTCQDETYLGAATGCCYGLMHFDFAGVLSESCGLTVEGTATEVTLIPTDACTASATVVVGGKTLTFALTQSPGVNVADMTVTIGDCSKVYHCEGFGSCAGTFNAAVDEESPDVWPDTIVVSAGAGASYTGPPVDMTPCPSSETYLDMYTVPTGPAPLFPPFQDCPTCWIIEPSGIADAFGGVSETCCNNLNGSHTLCYSPKESQGDNLIFGTPCLTSSGGSGNPQPECAKYEWYTESPIVVTGFPCALTYSGDFILQWLEGTGVGGNDCIFVANGAGQIRDYIAATCVDNFQNSFQSIFFATGDSSVWAFGTTTGISHKFATAITPGDPHGAFYSPASISTTVELFDTATFTRITDDINYPDSTLVGTWPDTIVLRRRGAGFCGPAPYDTQRRLWQLSYNKTAQKWRLESLASIKTPAYELDDTTPCVGDTKVLTKVDVGDSGCSTAPSTITLTRGTDTQCLDCNSYVEPGCQVQLVRQCGSDNYALRHTSVVSANPKFSHICAQTRGHHIKQCCDVGCNYTPDTAPDPPCCSIQKVMYSANNDPWFDQGGTVEVWKLDLTATPVQLIGTFFEGVIVYEVDSNGIQCGKTPTQLYRSGVLTTLPDDLKQLYPTNVCMVGDTLKTCNVRYMTPEEEGVDQNFLGGPCNSAGYDPDTGHEDFCACNDSCAPVLAGTIVTGAHGECVSVVCAARGQYPQMDPDHKSKYSYIACARIFNEATERYDVLVQIIYCVGPGARWASDWYCAAGQPESTGPFTPRTCTNCFSNLGAYLGTTYASRGECETLPGFGLPTVGAGGFGGIGYGTNGWCVCGNPCNCFDPVPTTLHMTVTTATTPCGTGNITEAGDYTLVAGETPMEWFGNASASGMTGAPVTVRCADGQWSIVGAEIDVGDVGMCLAVNQVECPGLLLVSHGLRFSSCDYQVTITL